LGEAGSTGLIVAAVLLLFGFLFSMSETSLTSISKLSIRTMKEDGKKRAELVDKLTSQKDRLLSSILIGNNLVTILISAIVTTFAINISNYENETRVVAIATAITSFVIIIFGDIMPKVLATKDPTRISLFVARPTSWLMFILSPISGVLNKVIGWMFSWFGNKDDAEMQAEKEQELETYIEMSYEEGVLHEDEKKMMDGLFEFRDNVARDIMVPRVEIIAIDQDANYDTVLEIFKKEQFTRLPVYEENIDNIVGILIFRDFILSDVPKKDFDTTKIMRKPFISLENLPTQELLGQMRQKGVSLAIIADEYGGTAGLVTMEDLVETIVGDIFDEYDLEDKEIKDTEITCITEGEEYRILGSVRIEDFNELLEQLEHTPLDTEDYDTIGGFVMGLLGIIPEGKEEIAHNFITFIVEEMERNRIGSLIVKIRPFSGEEDAVE